jgi:hypothetical protein
MLQDKFMLASAFFSGTTKGGSASWFTVMAPENLFLRKAKRIDSKDSDPFPSSFCGWETGSDVWFLMTFSLRELACSRSPFTSILSRGAHLERNAKVGERTYSKIPSIFDHVVRNSSTIKSYYQEGYVRFSGES